MLSHFSSLVKGLVWLFPLTSETTEKSPGSDTSRIDRLFALSSFSVWWCMAVFSFGEVICLVTSFHEPDLSLLNHVKYDSYLITSQTMTTTITVFIFQTCQLTIT